MSQNVAICRNRKNSKGAPPPDPTIVKKKPPPPRRGGHHVVEAVARSAGLRPRRRTDRLGDYLARSRAHGRPARLLLADGQGGNEEDCGELRPLRPWLGRGVEPGRRERVPLDRLRGRRRQGG